MLSRCGAMPTSQNRDMGHRSCGLLSVALIIWVAVGDVFGVSFARGVGEGDFAAVGRGDDVVGHGPVFCVGDCACGGGFYVEVVDFEVV